MVTQKLGSKWGEVLEAEDRVEVLEAKEHVIVRLAKTVIFVVVVVVVVVVVSLGDQYRVLEDKNKDMAISKANHGSIFPT